jgi:ribonuclease PH
LLCREGVAVQMRKDGREPGEMRKVNVKVGYLKHAEGSVLIGAGNTTIVCACSVENRVPAFLQGRGRGWVTAEYSLLPRSTHSRTPREAARGRISGRTHEIQRLIGRSLRAVVDLAALGDRTFTVDCDVIQADGGTRTLSITGAYIALYQAIEGLEPAKRPARFPILDFVAATSVGIVDGTALLDLCYEEDSRASVDFNVVMTGGGRFVEVQGTAEGDTFTRTEMNTMLALAKKGIGELVALQKSVLKVG